MSLVLLVGDRQAGKTSACRRLAERARDRGRSVAGIISPAVHARGHRVGYDVVDLVSGKTGRLAIVDAEGVERTGRFGFLAEGLELGRSALAQAVQTSSDLIIVDEVGPLEFAGGGWARHLDALAQHAGVTVFAIRPKLLASATERWNVPPRLIWSLAMGADAALDGISNLVGRDNSGGRAPKR